MSVTYIYGLCEPSTDVVRYVGKSNNPKNRLNKHLSIARTGKKTHCYSWLRKLIASKATPEIVILEECAISAWEECEQKWIAKLPNLTNLTTGGEGGKNLRKYTMTALQKQRLSNAMKGKKRPLWVRGKIGLAQRGKPKSAEHKRKISEALKGSANPMYGKKYVGKNYRTAITTAETVQNRKSDAASDAQTIQTVN